MKNNFNRFGEAKLWRKEIEKVWKSVIKTAVNTARVVRLGPVLQHYYCLKGNLDVSVSDVGTMRGFRFELHRRRLFLDPFRRTRLQISGVKSATASHLLMLHVRGRKPPPSPVSNFQLLDFADWLRYLYETVIDYTCIMQRSVVIRPEISVYPYIPGISADPLRRIMFSMRDNGPQRRRFSAVMLSNFLSYKPGLARNPFKPCFGAIQRSVDWFGSRVPTKQAKKPSLTLNLGTNGLKMTTNGRASSGHARRCLIWLSYDKCDITRNASEKQLT
ncbi:hypothetical protein J6590_041564 [Homalodisca vitripennis]|nr:hypothetical protein J6590_041564 [Homalodisca vitripennis]